MTWGEYDNFIEKTWYEQITDASLPFGILLNN